LRQVFGTHRPLKTVISDDGQAVTPGISEVSTVEPKGLEVSLPPNGHAPPTTIPADSDLPCAGQEVDTLKLAALAMLIAKPAALVQNHQEE
jgi:hypothetical protein